MKGLKVSLFLCLTLFFLAGCGSMAAIPYSAAKDDNETAEITFQTNLSKNGGAKSMAFSEESKKTIQLISIEGDETPLPKNRTVWNPVSLPADKPSTFIVNVFCYYNPDKKGNSHASGTELDLLLLPVIIAADIASEVSAQVYNEKARGWRYMDVTFNCPPLEANKKYKIEFIERWFQKPRLVLTDISAKKIVYEQVVDQKWQIGGKGNLEGEKWIHQEKKKK